MQLALRIAEMLPAAVRRGKQGFYAQLGQPLAQAYDGASRVMCANLALDDTAEGIAAFLDKRSPAWG